MDTKLTDDEIDDMARELGWADYPHDSLEQGRYWHCEPDKAPFGRVKDKSRFRRMVRQCESMPTLVKERLWQAVVKQTGE